MCIYSASLKGKVMKAKVETNQKKMEIPAAASSRPQTCMGIIETKFLKKESQNFQKLKQSLF